MKKVNWHNLLLKMKGKGMTMIMISKELGVSANTINNYKNQRSEPSYSNGQALIRYAETALSPEELRRCGVNFGGSTWHATTAIRTNGGNVEQLWIWQNLMSGNHSPEVTQSEWREIPEIR